MRAVPNLYPVLGETEGDDGGTGVVGVGGPGVPGASTGGGGRGERSDSGVSASIDPLHASTRGAEPNLFTSAPAAGAHEVIVHGPEHATALAQLDDELFDRVVAGWRERMRAHSGAAYVHLIVNEGPAAGASLEHSHAQLYALGFVPAEIARERERSAAYHDRTMGGHLLGDVLTEEVRRKERLVAIDDDAALISPWAARSPFELRIVPRRPAPAFEEDGAGTGMLRAAIRALAAAFERPPQLNLWVRTAPRDASEFCWHIDIVPRLTNRAGFELGTGVDINVYSPERAAADLRAALESH